MRLLIIGSSGFIGKKLSSAAVSQGLNVVTLARNVQHSDASVTGYLWSFGEPLPINAYKGVTCAVHLAHDFDGNFGAQLTYESTLAIAKQLKEAGIKRQIFFSSYSAGVHATSIYGKTKYNLEKVLKQIPGMIIVRPGLVLGDGGLYGRIQKWARVLPIILLPNGGKVPIIKIEKLCDLTLEIISNIESSCEINLFEKEFKTLHQIVLEAALEFDRKPWIFTIPASWLNFILISATRLHIPLPVNADNLAGFLANQSSEHESNIA
jgi:uncharacterized protein YbjT (DUF2867 family)